MEVRPSLPSAGADPWAAPGLAGFAREGQELQLQQSPVGLLATEMTSSTSIGPIGNATRGDSCFTGTSNTPNICWLVPTDKRWQNL